MSKPHPPSGFLSLVGGAFPRICGEALIAPSQHPDEILCVSFEINPHFPAFAVALPGARTRMMAKPGTSLGADGISIKFDKYR